MADLNRLLSELIEPIPTQELAYGCYHALSDKKGWRWMYSYKGVGHWQPRAWDTDENASAMLLDMLIHAGFVVEIYPQACDPRLIVIVRQVLGVRPKEYGRGHLQPDRKTAVRNCAYEWLAHKRQTGA